MFCSVSALSFQEMIQNLQHFWVQQGCAFIPGLDVEVGAGTFHPETTFRALGPHPYKIAYIQPSRRPQDGRYGENPNRFYKHHQFQVILKPSPENAQDLALKSLEAMGLSSEVHDLRFVEDNWASPTLGAAGMGYEVWCDGQEVLQFTYFQQMGGQALSPVTLELAYGLERIALASQDASNAYELVWSDGPPRLTYGDLFKKAEFAYSAYSFEEASTKDLEARFQMALKEGEALLKRPGLYRAAYERILHANHVFNTLEARGGVSPAERAGYVGALRVLAYGCFDAHRAFLEAAKEAS